MDSISKSHPVYMIFLQVVSSNWDGRPFGHNRHGPKRGKGKWGRAAVPLLEGGTRSPSKTMWPGPRYTSVPSVIFIHPAIWPQQAWANKKSPARGLTFIAASMHGLLRRTCNHNHKVVALASVEIFETSEGQWPWPWWWIGSRSHQHTYTCTTTSMPNDLTVVSRTTTKIWLFEFYEISTFREVWTPVIAFLEGNSKIRLQEAVVQVPYYHQQPSVLSSMPKQRRR